MAWPATKAKLRKLDTRLDVQNLAAKAQEAWLSISEELARKLTRHSNRILYAYKDGLTETAVYT